MCVCLADKGLQLIAPTAMEINHRDGETPIFPERENKIPSIDNRRRSHARNHFHRRISFFFSLFFSAYETFYERFTSVRENRRA